MKNTKNSQSLRIINLVQTVFYTTQHLTSIFDAVKKGSYHLFFTTYISTLYVQASEIVVDSSEEPSNSAGNWQFSLLELAGSHYASICMENSSTADGENDSMLQGIKECETK